MSENWKAKMTAAEENRLVIIGGWMEKGVHFPCPDGVLIDPEVTIGAGTTIEPGVILKGHTVIGENCTITAGSRIEDCVIGNETTINASQCYHSRLGDQVSVGPFSHIRPDSVLEDHVHVGDFVEIKNSVIGVGTAVAHLTYVGDSDVGRNVNFGCGCVTVNYDGVHKNRCRIGDAAFIGCNTNLIAPVTVGDRVFIAAGSTITDSLETGDFAIARARQVVNPQLGAEKLRGRKLKY